MSEQIYLSLYILGSLLTSEKGIAVKVPACLWLRDCLMTGLDTVLELGLKKVTVCPTVSEAGSNTGLEDDLRDLA